MNENKFNKSYWIELFKKISNDNDENIYDKCMKIVKKYDDYWYSNYKDFSFYEEYEYVYDAFISFLDYTRGQISFLKKYFESINYSPKIILDFGAGIGFSTAYLAMLFPNSEIIYHNIGKYQIEFIEKVKNYLKLDNVKIVIDKKQLNDFKFDVICTFEVLEHFEEPLIEYEFLKNINTKYWIDTNTFSIKSAGHFDEYLIDGNKVSNQQIRHQLCKHVKNEYQIEKTGFNGRPRVWRKK